MSDETCKSCGNYDDRKVGGGPRERPAPYGWCKALSVYSESDGAKPEGAKTTPSPVAQPCIVRPDEIRRGCPHRSAT